MIYRDFGKRALDLLVSSLMLLLLLPVFLLLGVLLSLHFRDSPFYTQLRAGKDGVLFPVLKFKTMSDARGGEGKPLSDEQRMTWLGNAIRKSSLDEIPQLLNVLRGDMSLVGPRPLLVEYLPLYTVHQARRHEVRPGVTGLAQVNGRNAISWEQKFDYDVDYVEGFSLGLDLKILFATIWTVLRSEGISPAGSVTVGRFTGSN